MANQLFGNFLFTDAGVAINAATVDLLDRNTTTPVRATTTTNASGYWAISHATEGRFDVRITNGSSVRWHKYDTESQITTLEVAQFRVRNPADTFDYDIVPAAITADRQLNLPLITATDTLAALALAQTFLTGVKTFNSSILAIRNPADTFSYTVVASAITAARNLTVPLLTADDTLAVLGLAQTFTAAQTFSGGVIFTTTQVEVADDILFTLGNDNDGVLLNRSTILATNTALTGVMIGTPVTPAIAANSVIVSNVTASGDYILALNVGGNSQAWQWVDSSAGTQTLYAAGVARILLNSTGGSFTGTWSDLGIVTTVDINGGTLAGVTVDGGLTWSAAQNFGAFNVYINDTANTFMTVGLTIHGAGNDNEHLALKNSDVGHPMTAIAEADTFATFQKQEATSGGLRITGLKDADGAASLALDLLGILGEAADTTDTSASFGVVRLRAEVTNGATDTTAVAATGNVLTISNLGTTSFLIKGNGDLHVTAVTDVAAAGPQNLANATALDAYDDAALSRALQKIQTPRGIIESEWEDFVTYNEQDLIDAGILSPAGIAGGGLMNQSQLLRLHNGALWQLRARQLSQERENAALKAEIAELRRALPAA